MGQIPQDIAIRYPGKGKLTEELKKSIELDVSAFEKALFSFDYNSGQYGYEPGSLNHQEVLRPQLLLLVVVAGVVEVPDAQLEEQLREWICERGDWLDENIHALRQYAHPSRNKTYRH